MCELVSFYAGLSPRDFWALTGYERGALQAWREKTIEAQLRAVHDERWNQAAAAERRNP